MKISIRAGLARIAILAAGLTSTVAAQTTEETARALLGTAGVRGGVVVHVGCGDGRLTAALRAGESFIVQGLDADAKNVEAARAYIRSRGLYGPVAADRWDGGRLPFVENFVNLAVVSDGASVPDAELLRVLAPNGVALVGGRKIVKPRPATIDEWTHYLHDPGNNAVAHDTEIDRLVRMQWLAGPRYSRHHDHMSGASAMVSAGGRNFYIFEEAPRASILIPPQWHLYARDAFNGTLLWKRPIGRWHEHMYPLKSGPQILPRRLVAAGDKVYVTLNIDDPLSELDAATGRTLKVYDGTAATEEIVLSDGVLFLAVAAADALRSDPKRVFQSMDEIRRDVTEGLWGVAPRTIMAVEASSGRRLWSHASPLMPVTLAADARSVFFHDGDRVVCLDRATGRPRWASDPVPNQKTLRSSAAPTLVVVDDVVVFSGYSSGDNKRRGESTTMYALSARSGQPLWKAEHPPAGHAGSPKDILVLNGVVWCGATAQSSDSGISIGRDLHTGNVVKEFPPDVKTHWFHQRCYRQKATDRFLLYSRTGIEFVDVENETWTCHHWTRGACLYGIMPANGMIYNPPHPCACYLDAKLFGFHALAPASTAWTPPREVPDEGRLERGPAYGGAAAAAGEAAGAEDWPTYRGNAARGGFVSTRVPASALKSVWQADIGGRLSAPVIAGGRVYIAVPDRHAVLALDEKSGRPCWSFTAGGRVDSAPTVWQGRVLFGSADGRVYCLRADDGALVWRFRAAPEDRRHFAFEQIESVWPVGGSVLVQDGALYCVAGRSMFLDGGLRLLRLDPATGRRLSETILDDRDPESGDNLQTHIKSLNMPTALADILSGDGRYVYMRTLPFHPDGRRKTVGYVDVKDQQGDDRHLFSPTGFLDDTLWHRTYWVYGRAFASGAGGYYQAGRLTPSGRLLVLDDQRVYGYGRLWQYYRWTTPMENHLFAAPRDPEQVRMGVEPPKQRRADGRVKGNMTGSPVTRFGYEWSSRLDLQATAMALAGSTLFVAGPPDLVDEEAAVRALGDPETRAKLAEQSAAFEGRRGALLAAVNASDGRALAAYRLDSAPVFDGLAAANGRLFLATLDGKLLCFGGDGNRPLAPAGDAVAVPRGPDADPPVGEVPPATTSKPKQPAARPAQAPARSPGTVGARVHPDFQHLAGASIADSRLGYKVVTDAGAHGLALKTLSPPLTGRAEFRMTMQPTREGKLETGFLAFGDNTDEEHLVRCGVRLRVKKAMILQDGGREPRDQQDFERQDGGPIEVVVTVDLEAKTVRMTLPGRVIEAPLRRPLQAITHLGYFVMDGVTEFSPIKVSGR